MEITTATLVVVLRMRHKQQCSPTSVVYLVTWQQKANERLQTSMSAGMTQALRDWVDGIPDASKCCSISRPAACWHCSGEDSAQSDASLGMRAAWTWLMAFVGCLDEHGMLWHATLATNVHAAGIIYAHRSPGRSAMTWHHPLHSCAAGSSATVAITADDQMALCYLL